MARYMRSDLGRGHAFLRPPVVLGTAEESPHPPLVGFLHPVAQTTTIVRQRRPRSFLLSPTVVSVEPPAPVVYPPLIVLLHPLLGAAARQRRPTVSVLAPPAALAVVATQLFFASAPRLTRTRRGTLTNSQLLPPTVVFPAPGGGDPVSGIRGWRTFSSRTRPTVNSQLLPPTVVFPAPGGGEPLAGIRGRLVYSPTRRPRFRSRLSPPRVVASAESGVVYPPLQVLLHPVAQTTFIVRQRRTRVALGKPRVVTAVVTQTFSGPAITLARSASQPRRARSTYIYPRVIGRNEAFGGIGITLVRRYTPPVYSTLRPVPLLTVAENVVYPPLSGSLHPVAQTTFIVRQRRPRSRLGAPRVVATAAVVRLAGPEVTLVRRRVPLVGYGLAPPAVTESIVVTVDPHPPLVVLLHPLRTAAQRLTMSGLAAPAVLGTAGPLPVGPATTLAYSRRGKAKSALRKPLVIDLRPQTRFLSVTLAPSRDVRHEPYSRLRPPTVVQAREVIFYGPSVWLTYSRRGAPKSSLNPPTVIDLRPQVYYLATTLVRIRPRPTTTFLRPPADTVGLEDQGKVSVNLTYSRRGRPVSRLLPPTVVGQAREIYGPEVALAYSLRGKPKSRLAPPVVIDLRPQTYYLTVTLAPARDLRHEPYYRLAPPVVVQAREVVFFGPVVWITYSRRGAPKSVLYPPTVIDLRPQTYFVQVNLTYSRRGAPQSFLRPPVDVVDQADLGYVRVYLAPSSRGIPKPFFVVAEVVNEALRFYGPAVTLAPSKRGVPQSFLRSPVVIDLRPQVFYLSLTLARNKPQPTFTLLRPSMVTVALPRAERELRIFLTYSRRGAPKSVLRKPLVIDLRPQTQFLSVSLAYSRRGRPKSELSPPAVIGRLVLHPIAATLAYSRRGRPESRLQPPAVIRIFAAAPVQVQLAYSRRGRPVFELRPPTVVFPFFARPLAVTLTYSLRGKPKSILRKPIVVRLAVEIYGPEVTLTYSRRGAPESFLQPPTAVFPFFARPTVITLAYSLRGKPKPVLRAPVVVYPAFFAEPISVTFARNKPQPTWTRLQPPTVIGDFRPDQGDVCGTDEAGTTVVGLSSSESTICGGDSELGTVCGTDEQNT